jgi:uncharacterized membrane protein YebE (DUF533 family)|tara:strand:+ start:691 stop:1116 length:426 start_codon:yes stop_codon:yes gene_type:complete
MSLMNKFESGDDKQKKSHVKNLIKMAAADGHIDDVEKEFLYKVAKKYSVEPEEVQYIIDNPNDYAFAPPATKEDRHAQLLNLTIMMMIDDVIDDNEMSMLKKFAIGLGYPIMKVDKLIKVAIDCVREDLDEDDAIDKLDEA